MVNFATSIRRPCKKALLAVYYLDHFAFHVKITAAITTIFDFRLYIIRICCLPSSLLRGITSRIAAIDWKNYHPRHSACYYFGVRSEDERWAEEERSRWVLDVSRAIRLATGIATENGSWLGLGMFGFGFNAMIRSWWFFTKRISKRFEHGM